MRYIPSDRLLIFNSGQQVLPPGFEMERACEAVVDKEVRVYKRFKKVLAGKAVGFRFQLGPVIVDHFVGDAEPHISAHEGPLRRVTWQPTTRRDLPSGWHETISKSPLKRSGFVQVDGRSDYDKTWTQHARRHKRNWLKQDQWEIREIGLQAFLDAYWKSPKDAILKALFTHFLRKKVEAHGPYVHLAAVVKKGKPEEIGAGFAFVDMPEAKQSVHTISFVHRAAKDSSAGTGLIDYWFQHAVKNKIEFLNFGNYWAPGCPADWIGFSEFKAQFGITLIDHPNQVARFAGTWKELFTGHR